MNLEELKAKAEAATPEKLVPGVWEAETAYRNFVPVHRRECGIFEAKGCGCDYPERENSIYTFQEAASAERVLALVKAVEALQEFRDADRDPTRIDELVGRLADTFDALEELEAME